LKLDLPSARQALTDGREARPSFYAFWEATRRMLSGIGGIPRLPSYTVSTLPDAAENARGLIYVSNGTGNKRLAISDGTNWRFPDGNVVS